MKTKTTTRRAVLSGAAVLSAIAVLAPAIANATVNPDAELFALGAELNPVLKEWLALSAIGHKRQAIFEARVEQATGIAYRDRPNPWMEDDEEKKEAAERYWKIRTSVPSAIDARGDDDDDDKNPWTALAVVEGETVTV